MMQELLDFFLGAIHLYVVDPDLIPVVDAVGSLIVCTLVLGTACSLMIWAIRLVWIALFGGGRMSNALYWFYPSASSNGCFHSILKRLFSLLRAFFFFAYLFKRSGR